MAGSQSTEDTRIGDVRPLLPPACLAEEIPLSRKAQDCVVSARQGVQVRPSPRLDPSAHVCPTTDAPHPNAASHIAFRC